MAESKGSLIAKSVSKHAGRAKEKVRDACLPLLVFVFIVSSSPSYHIILPFFFHPLLNVAHPVAVVRVLYPLRPLHMDVRSSRLPRNPTYPRWGAYCFFCVRGQMGKTFATFSTKSLAINYHGRVMNDRSLKSFTEKLFNNHRGTYIRYTPICQYVWYIKCTHRAPLSPMGK